MDISSRIESSTLYLNIWPPLILINIQKYVYIENFIDIKSIFQGFDIT